MAGNFTYCKYQYYGKEISYCTTLPPDKATAACNEQATKKHGEKIVCWCTNDQSYIGDRCG
jgi:hypothetical protein